MSTLKYIFALNALETYRHCDREARAGSNLLELAIHVFTCFYL